MVEGGQMARWGPAGGAHRRWVPSPRVRGSQRSKVRPVLEAHCGHRRSMVELGRRIPSGVATVALHKVQLPPCPYDWLPKGEGRRSIPCEGNQQVKAAAIVSAYYCEKYLEGRLENLLAQTERPRIVVVALQNSPEQAIAARMLEREHDSLLMTDAVPTIYHAWDLGSRAARTESGAAATADARLGQDGIETLVKALDDPPQAALVYPDVDIVKD